MCHEGPPERKSTAAQEMSKGWDEGTCVITPTPLFHTLYQPRQSKHQGLDKGQAMPCEH
jgi:hypothetical protein